jgi:hypothetical protein
MNNEQWIGFRVRDKGGMQIWGWPHWIQDSLLKEIVGQYKYLENHLMTCILDGVQLEAEVRRVSIELMWKKCKSWKVLELVTG